MNKKAIFPIILLSLAIALIGCQPSPTSAPTVTLEPPTLSPSPTTTSTTKPITPAPTSTVAPTHQGSDRLTVNCLEILPSLPEDAELNGQIFLRGEWVYGKDSTGPDSKLDNETRTPIPITLQAVYYPIVSPNGKRWIYIKTDRNADGEVIGESMVIEDAAGRIVAEVPYNWGVKDASWYWLDNDRIVISESGFPHVLDPFTGKYIEPDWIDQAPGGLIIGTTDWEANALFDSRLSRVFYREDLRKMWLWDIEAKQVLAELTARSNDYPHDTPQWGSDDSQIVLAYRPADLSFPYPGQELFSISRDGTIMQLTELGKDYPVVAISTFSWSPDGRKIAFFFREDSLHDISSQFAILDMDTLKVTNYCDLAGAIYSGYVPIWLPDSQKLLIGRVEADQETYSTVLLDLVNGYAATLVRDLVPWGWMVAP